MKHILIYSYLIVLPIIGLAQPRQFDSKPKVPPCYSCVVVRETKKGKIQRVRVAYDNFNSYQYIKIQPNRYERIQAVERVVFEYDRTGLKIYAYVPKTTEYLTKSFLADFGNPNPFATQAKDSIQLYHLKIAPDNVDITESVPPKPGIGVFGPRNPQEWLAAELKNDLNKTIAYHDIYPNSRKTLRDAYRASKNPKWYFETGMTTGLSYRDIQIVNPLPDRTTYQSRLRDEKAQLSLSGSVRAGRHFTKSSSIYAGLLYLRQELRSLGPMDWNTGLTNAGSSDFSNYRFEYKGAEIGYSNSPFQRKNSISADFGFHLLWVTNTDRPIQKFTWGPHLAIGPKIRMGAKSELRIMPTLYYNVRSLEKHRPGAPKQELATRMFTTGIKVSMRWY